MNSNIKNLVRSSLFLAMAIIFQAIGRTVPQISQFFVGPAVNAILILTTCICGIWWGIAVGTLTPLLAWLLGQLPPPFGPFIPFIMIGNIIFITLFWISSKYIKKAGNYIGIIIGAIVKYLFLYLSASKLIGAFNLNIPAKVASKLVKAMGIPQLITALIGGAVALIILKLLKNRKQI